MPEIVLPSGDGFLKRENGEWVCQQGGPGGYDGDPTAIEQDATHRFVTDAEKTTWNGHNHDAAYEPKNPNIQSHISSQHAPANAQKNSDITKAEIEAKLTGEITSHTHPGGSDPFTAKLVLGADVNTGANVTPVNLTGMAFTYLPNSTYVIEFYMAATAAAATTGHGFGLNCTTAPVLAVGAGTSELANTGTVTGWQFIANNAIAGVTSGIPTANALTPSFGQGVLRTNASTGGTCQFIFRSEATAVATCKAGSTITVIKVA